MENKINIAELLKDCPKDMELDCTMYDSVTLLNVNDREDATFPIKVLREDGNYIALTKYGQYTYADFAKCVIFPKGKTTWEGFQRPFMDGDILISGLNSCEGNPFIFKQINSFGNAECYCAINCYGELIFNSDNWTHIKGCKLATEEEKKKLFDAIKANGYKWNPETKTLEKFPKFKVGDKIKHKDSGIYCTLGEYSEGISAYRTNIGLSITCKDLEDWELVQNKFDITTLKPFEKVLVRHNKDNKWCGSFFSHIDDDFHSHCYKYVTIAGKSYPMCIPYEGNEHLRGTTDDCDEYFKNW